jgi:hypothetical protein
VSVGVMPRLILKDSDGNLVNGATVSIFPGQVRIISFSSTHADRGEVLVLGTTGILFSSLYINIL